MGTAAKPETREKKEGGKGASRSERREHIEIEVTRGREHLREHDSTVGALGRGSRGDGRHGGLLVLVGRRATVLA